MQKRGSELFDFQNYRAFLTHYFAQIHRKNTAFTYGAWSKALGLRSTSSLTKIITGKRDPGPDTIERFIDYFKFDDKEAQYFKSLVVSARKRSDAQVSKIIYEKLAQLRGRANVFVVENQTLSLFSRWYYPAIYEAIKISGACFSPESLSKKFRFPVSPAQVKEALANLMRLGLIRKTTAGYESLHRNIESRDDVPRSTIRQHHKETLQQTIEAIEAIPFSERELSNATLVIDEAKYEEARQAIKNFKNTFIEQFAAPEGKVMRLQIQFLPLTESLASKEKE